MNDHGGLGESGLNPVVKAVGPRLEPCPIPTQVEYRPEEQEELRFSPRATLTPDLGASGRLPGAIGQIAVRGCLGFAPPLRSCLSRQRSGGPPPPPNQGGGTPCPLRLTLALGSTFGGACAFRVPWWMRPVLWSFLSLQGNFFTLSFQTIHTLSALPHLPILKKKT